MAKTINKLTARQVETIMKPGRHSDGGCLYLVVTKSGARNWTFMYVQAGKQREGGLGSAGKGGVSLKDAREKAAAGRALLQQGLDPLTEWKKSAPTTAPTFGQVADAYLATHQDTWRHAKHREQWQRTLTRDCKAIRDKPVDAVSTDDVLSLLRPLWARIQHTASRTRGRIEVVLDAARAQGHIGPNVANPARWKGHLALLLPKRQALTRGHNTALPYDAMPAFVAQLRTRPATAARALEFCILTAARSAETFGARWHEIDLAAKVWSVPAERMKSNREHRVPLSPRAVDILSEMGRAGIEPDGFVFPGTKLDRPLSNMSMAMLLRRMGIDVTPHGFRSSFRDWTGDRTDFQREVAEAALAHIVGDKAEQAYRRNDALEKRRRLMEAWADFLEPKATPAADGNAAKAADIFD